MTISNSVWGRTHGGHEMSKNAFAALTCFWTAIGLATSAGTAYLAIKSHLTLGWPLVIGVLISGVIGVIMANVSENPLVSLIGYFLVAAPFGLMLGPVVVLYTSASLVRVLSITTGMVVLLGIVGAVIPDSLESWGGWLFGGLSILLLGMFVVPIAGFFGVPIQGAMTALDWVGVLLFGAYVLYDMNRAMRVERTLDNSIDCALALYLDFVNIFVRLLELTGKRTDD